MKRLILHFALIIIVIFAVSCTKSTGPNRKSDARKRAIEYVMDKYGDEFENIDIRRLSFSGEKLTYQNSYIVTDIADAKPYNVVVHYDEDGRFVDIGDDRESETIRKDFLEYATILGSKPETFSIGNGIDGGGESTIERPIYYYYEKYDGDIASFIKNYNGVIYISYRFTIPEQEQELERIIKSIQNECNAVLEVRCSVSRKYNAGVSTAFPAESVSSYSLKKGVLGFESLTKKTHSLNNGITVSTYIEESSKNMIEAKMAEYKSQCLFLAKDNVLLRVDNVYTDNDGVRLDSAYRVGSGFIGELEVAFDKSKYNTEDVAIYDAEFKRIQPSVSDNRFYEDEQKFYFLVKEQYILSLK